MEGRHDTMPPVSGVYVSGVYVPGLFKDLRGGNAGYSGFCGISPHQRLFQKAGEVCYPHHPPPHTDQGSGDIDRPCRFRCPAVRCRSAVSASVPESMQAIKAMVRSHDGLLIATPEYNRFIPPLLVSLFSVDLVLRGADIPAAIMALSNGGDRCVSEILRTINARRLATDVL